MMRETPQVASTPKVPHVDLVFSSITCLLSLIHVLGVLQVTAGILVTTFIPGYAFGLCIFPKQGQLREIERWGLALIISTCLGMFLPLVLSATGWGVSNISYSISMGIIMLVFFTIVLIRRRNIPLSEIYSPGFMLTKTFGWITVFIAFLATLVTLIVRHNTVSPPAFFVTNTDGTFRNYPFDVTKGQKVYVQLHVVNPTTNVLRGFIEAMDHNRVFFKREVTVSQRANLTIVCKLPSQKTSATEKVTLLFQPKNATGSRTLWITYHINSP